MIDKFRLKNNSEAKKIKLVLYFCQQDEKVNYIHIRNYHCNIFFL